MASLKTLCGLAAAMLILAGCGGNGSNASSPSASATSTAPSATGTSGSTSAPTSSSGSGSTPPPSSSPPSSPPPSSPPPSNPPTSSTGSATLKWTAPTQDTNGSALTNLAGYYIYYGTSAGSLSTKVSIASPGTLTYTVGGLGQGTWYFAIAAYTNTGVQSSLSNVGSKTIS